MNGAKLNNPCRDGKGAKCERLKEDPTILPECRATCPIYREHERIRIEGYDTRNREKSDETQIFSYERDKKMKIARAVRSSNTAKRRRRK